MQSELFPRNGRLVRLRGICFAGSVANGKEIVYNENRSGLRTDLTFDKIVAE